MSYLLEIIKRCLPNSVKRLVPISLKEQAKVPITSFVRMCNWLNSGSRALPDFIIIGAQKCGTSTLYAQLCQHPKVFPSILKEVQYFTWNYRKGLSWYRAHFPVRKETKDNKITHLRFLTGEASPYYIFYPHALPRIHRILPGVKIIIMLRNPVDRAYSSYQHERRKGREPYPFEKAIDLEEHRLRGEWERIMEDEDYFSYNHARFAYKARGIYVDQIQRCLNLFPEEQVLILESEEFFSDNRVVYERVLEFLGLPKFSLPQYQNVNKKPYEGMNPEIRIKLVDYFRPYNEALYELLSRRFSWDR